MGHRDLLVTQNLSQAIEQQTLHYLTRSVRRRAATSKRGNRLFLSTPLRSLLRVVFLVFLWPLHQRPRLARNLSVGFSPTQPSLRSKLRPRLL